MLLLYVKFSWRKEDKISILPVISSDKIFQLELQPTQHFKLTSNVHRQCLVNCLDVSMHY